MNFLLSWLGKEGQITTYGASLAQEQDLFFSVLGS